MADRYALCATVRLNGAIVEEVRAESGQELLIGRRGDAVVPVPASLPFLARARWKGREAVDVEDGRGEVHRLGPEGTLDLRLGPLHLELRLAQALTLRRTQPIAWYGSLAFFTVLMGMTVLVGQVEVVTRNLCPWFGIACPILQEASGVDGGIAAEYLARLLREDYEGYDDGVIMQQTPTLEPKADDFMPAGDIGPVTEFGGAEETAPEPVRTPPETESAAQPAGQDNPERTIEPADAGTPITPPADRALDGEAQVDEGLDTDAPDDAVPEPDLVPAEEEQGWGIKDWMDASAAERETMEVDAMIDLAQRRLRIDPDDPQALGILSYYQYLQGDLDAAERTFDRLIKLFPEDPAGHNNLALVFKRRGDYVKEEGLYRVALAYDPNDYTAMNNLAVNLAHQGRFDEALSYMARVEEIHPGDPYSDLHRSKIHAERGDDELALVFLKRALEGMARLDTLHHIEFRQDIRVDPSFGKLRKDPRFHAILREYYGDDTPLKE